MGMMEALARHGKNIKKNVVSQTKRLGRNIGALAGYADEKTALGDKKASDLAGDVKGIYNLATGKKKVAKKK